MKNRREAEIRVMHEAIQRGHKEQDDFRAVRELLESLEGSQKVDLLRLHPCVIPAARALAARFGYVFDLPPLKEDK